MRDMRTRTGVVALLCAAVAMTVAACGDDGDEGATTSSSASSSPTYGEDHIMAEVKKADKVFTALDPNTSIPKDADWATDKYRKVYNDELASWKDMGVVQKGKVTTRSLHMAKSDPDAPGGWDVTVYVCTVSTVRAYIDGEDVTADPREPEKALPKGPREGVLLYSYTTPDGGKSWQLDDSQILTGTKAKEAPCAA